jgi:hypothetical protein
VCLTIAIYLVIVMSVLDSSCCAGNWCSFMLLNTTLNNISRWLGCARPALEKA